jgi:hypothetical protein
VFAEAVVAGCHSRASIVHFDTRRVLTILVSQVVAGTAVALAIHKDEQIVTRTEDYAHYMLYLVMQLRRWLPW